jgi:NADH-quinone oxidoreductase E subunit
MSGGVRVGKASFGPEQPESFSFTPENLDKAAKIIAKYPPGRQQSAVMPLLFLAQRQNDNWLPRAAMDAVADMLGMPRIRAYEVATFYSMYNLQPVGKHFIEICTTTPCWLMGSDGIVEACRRKLGISPGETTPDGQFTVVEVECLGACVNAPMVQIEDEYYEDLTPERMEAMIDALRQGKPIQPGSQVGRRGAQAATGPTSLHEAAKAAGVES